MNQIKPIPMSEEVAARYPINIFLTYTKAVSPYGVRLLVRRHNFVQEQDFTVVGKGSFQFSGKSGYRGDVTYCSIYSVLNMLHRSVSQS